jgi:hypothetical protein
VRGLLLAAVVAVVQIYSLSNETTENNLDAMLSLGSE